jgi:3-oxoacid CoA-transferase subunit A
MKKILFNATEAISDIPDGATIMVGGFGLCGVPERLISALADFGTRNLTLISSHAGQEGRGVGLLLEHKQLRRLISTYLGDNPRCEKLVLERALEIELSPQGTFAERIRCGGAGLGGFYTPTGVGTIVAEGKETRSWNGRFYLLEHPLQADFALIRAWKADTAGNLVYRKTARNFNPVMASAAKVTIAEVDEMVEEGQLDPDFIHTPGIFVQCLLAPEPDSDKSSAQINL